MCSGRKWRCCRCRRTCWDAAETGEAGTHPSSQRASCSAHVTLYLHFHSQPALRICFSFPGLSLLGRFEAEEDHDALFKGRCRLRREVVSELIIDRIKAGSGLAITPAVPRARSALFMSLKVLCTFWQVEVSAVRSSCYVMHCGIVL